MGHLEGASTYKHILSWEILINKRNLLAQMGLALRIMYVIDNLMRKLTVFMVSAFKYRSKNFWRTLRAIIFCYLQLLFFIGEWQLPGTFFGMEKFCS